MRCRLRAAAAGSLPIWVVGMWPRPKSVRRALRCDGIIAEYQLGEGREPTPGDARQLREWLTAQGAGPGFDMVLDGETSAGDPGAASRQAAEWAEAGYSWWLETRWGKPETVCGRVGLIAERIAAGPPAA